VATGTGNAACILAKHLPDGKITGIDFSEGMLAQAKAKIDQLNIENINLLKMDMQKLEFPNNTFDAAISAFSIFFIDDMETQLRHIAQKVKNNGRILMTTFSSTLFKPLRDMAFNRLKQYNIDIPSMPSKKVETEAQCHTLFETTGLTDIKVDKRNLSYYLDSPADWWTVLWNTGMRGIVSQLSPQDLKQFKKEHLAEVEKHSTDKGLLLQVEVLYTTGIKS
jgi:ubiquinone/menaquinone biosynthesis C-methylase UbiE